MDELKMIHIGSFAFWESLIQVQCLLRMRFLILPDGLCRVISGICPSSKVFAIAGLSVNVQCVLLAYDLRAHAGPLALNAERFH